MLAGAALADETAPPPPATPTETSPTAPQQPATTSGESQAEDQQVVCKKVDAPTGSRMGGKKVCHTAADWRRLQEASKEVVDDAQKRDSAWNPPGG
jgi:hypothetical protein